MQFAAAESVEVKAFFYIIRISSSRKNAVITEMFVHCLCCC